MNLSKNKPIKILVQRADKLGDTILSLPVMIAIHKAYPKVQLDMITSSIGKQFMESQPYIHTIHEVEWTNKETPKNFRKLVKKIKEQKYDIYLSLWNQSWMAWLGALAKIPIRIGDSTHWPKSMLYTHKVRQTWENITRHQIEFNGELLKPLNITLPFAPCEMFVSAQAEENMKALFKKVVSPQKKTVILFTATGGTNYPIPEPAMFAFIDQLIKAQNFNVVLIGQANSDSPFFEFKKNGVLNLVNKTSLQELCAAIKLSDIYVGPDTGPTHIASFCKKPILFFSSMKPNPPSRWGPLSPYFRIIRKDTSCTFFCVKKCHPTICFQFVTDTLLMNELNELLHQISMSDKKSQSEIKRYHLQHSLRVVHVFLNEEQYKRAFDDIKEYRKKGLFIQPIVLTKSGFQNVKLLIKSVIRYNVTIIQGLSLPRALIKIVQLYMGVIAAYTTPLYVNLGIYKNHKIKDYYDIYSKLFENLIKNDRSKS